ncbi:MAG: ThuA domain-containing protein [Phycisphaerae bacterium]|nr:ThuA domain-containing protein [Phycisphaerae bacterium]
MRGIEMGSLLKKIVVCVFMIGIAGCAFAVNEDEIAKINAAAPTKAPASPKKTRKVLVFSLCKGWKHGCIPYWEQALSIMGEKTGAFTVDHSIDMSVFTADNLKQYDAICFNNTTKLEPDAVQQKAIMDFITGGKGIVGVHAATDNFYNWPEGNMMMGGVFTGHPWGGGGTWAVKIDDPEHPLMKMFAGKGFKINDEIYRTDEPQYTRSNQRVLMSLDMSDEKTKNAGGVKPSDMDTGISWIKSVGKGRLFYCSLGHNNHLTWYKPLLEHYLAGIQFAMGDLDVDTAPVLPFAGEIGPDIRTLLKPVMAFEYGKSRKPLIDFENVLKQASSSPERLQSIESSMCSELLSGGTNAGKQFICQKLGLIGTSQSAVPLGLVLKITPEISADAIMALERIGGSAVENVLLDNLDSAQGDVKVGIINALGSLKSNQSVEVIGALALSSDKKVAVAAIAALNNIGTRKASEKLSAVLKKVDPTLKAVVQGAIIECVNKAPAGDWKFDVCKSVYDSSATPEVKAAALKGIVSSLGNRAGETIVAGLKSDEPAVVDAAVSCIGDVKRVKVVAGIFGCFDDLGADAQFKLLSCGEQMGTPAVSDAAFKSVSSDDEKIRIVAIKALSKVGGVKAVSVLVDKILNSSGTEQAVARESLYLLSGPGVDEEIVLLAKKNKQTELIQAVGYRKIAGAVGMLAELTASSDTNVATQAFRSLAMAGTSDDIELAVGLLVNLKNESLRPEAEKCLAEIIVSNDVNIKPLISAIESAKDTKLQVSLVMALGKTGVDKAFGVLYDIITDAGKSDEVKIAAIAALSDSSNGNVVSYLMKAYENLSNKYQKALAFKGIVKTIPLNGGGNTQVKIELFKKALGMSSSEDEKKLVFSEVSKIHNVDTLKFVMSYIEDPVLKDDAAGAAISIAYRLSENRNKQNRDAARQAMEKVMEVSSNDQTKSKAKRVLDGIKD